MAIPGVTPEPHPGNVRMVSRAGQPAKPQQPECDAVFEKLFSTDN
ncbi:MAG TPA: hypothetical protein VKH45_01115 [Candidatus Acidoferrum sp.]|nr:hypothetical protein [Candidatus Acidoferrum sp.]